jgi:hypothetical protein
MLPRPQISLRVFLILCIGIGFGIGIFRVWILQPYIARADAERRLREAGVTMIKNGATHYPSYLVAKLGAPAPHESTAVERLLSLLSQREITFETVSEISFLNAHRHATDADMDDICQFPEVENLDLTRIQVTRFPGGFRSTNVGAQEITDKGVEKIADLPKLRKLVIGAADLSDSALFALSKSASLEQIGVHRSRITDAGLVALAGIPSLAEVHVANNDHISQKGIGQFVTIRPNVEIWPPYRAGEAD